jgi:hypothetical protein
VTHYALYVINWGAVRDEPGGVRMTKVVEPEPAVSGTSYEGHGGALAVALLGCCRAIGRGLARDPGSMAPLLNGAQEGGADQRRAPDASPEESAPGGHRPRC